MFLSITLGNIKENLTISICGNPISQKNYSTSNIKCYFVFINGDAIQDVAFHNIVVMRSMHGQCKSIFCFSGKFDLTEEASHPEVDRANAGNKLLKWEQINRERNSCVLHSSQMHLWPCAVITVCSFPSPASAPTCVTPVFNCLCIRAASSFPSMLDQSL